MKKEENDNSNIFKEKNKKKQKKIQKTQETQETQETKKEKKIQTNWKFKNISFDTEDEKSSENIILVNPEPNPEKTKVKYSVPQTVNQRFLNVITFLEQLTPHITNIGITKSAYEKGVINPLNKFINGKVKSKKKIKNPDEPTKPSSFQIPRKATKEFDQLYNKLKNEENNMSQIKYEKNEISLIDSAKTIRIYINTHNLKNEDTKMIHLDSFLENIFKNKINTIYETNKENHITQRQVQTLASWLIEKSQK